MKKLIIQYKDFILKVHTSENNTTIFSSHLVKKPSDMKSILYLIRNKVSNNYSVHIRSLQNLIREWKAHNLLYWLGIYKDRTKDVDLNLNQSWYIKLVYFIISLMYPY